MRRLTYPGWIAFQWSLTATERVVATLKAMVPATEEYSINECCGVLHSLT